MPRRVDSAHKAILIITIIIVVGIITWLKSASLAETLLSAITAAATAAMAIMIKELDITLQHLRFQSLQRVYEEIDKSEFKSAIEELLKAIEIALESHSSSLTSRDTKSDDSDNIFKFVLDSMDNAKIRQKGWKQFCKEVMPKVKDKVRNPSIVLNKVGFLLYKDFIDEDYLIEEFGGLIMRAFAIMRPLLVIMRNCSEPLDRPWFSRRFALYLYRIVESKLSKSDYRDHIRNWLSLFAKNDKNIIDLYIKLYTKCIHNIGDKRICEEFCPVCNPEYKDSRSRFNLLDKLINGECTLTPPRWFDNKLKSKLRKKGISLPKHITTYCDNII